ncbi:MAG: hypothetical protein FJ267_01640 [Planctomycetes bacterium]|nr:hypothetical protein [Planctomycetota bacterium]
MRGRNAVRMNSVRPNVAYRQRGPVGTSRSSNFSAPEVWHDPVGRSEIEFICQSPGQDYFHPITVEDVRARIELLPKEIVQQVEVIQFSEITRKRKLFPLYGMQWGPNVYLYPMEASLVETYKRPPTPKQLIEASMYGGQWVQERCEWQLRWTLETIRDFYLNNVLIHEIGHVIDQRNTNSEARERYANWFAIEYGFRVSRGRR